ncbi:DegV family protein [Lactiplantibacillus mudanjiangensis]|uniref:Fatty acid-binding protein DegV [Lactobacillus pentosus] n=1 Tax=Lactiplantibacillus mudanjiangensis TaxID=1296538 RepID=A0A660E237_9LACO|nr:DegV family protein [Lactiplantibacillus mudanjiangensis]VDG20898.1 fatty acid-binding protein DegV [Lactobacillus pentosus] [Lactiplantibacillus mudanjiangensis]VDG22629.1 fatty acid-binding protein DegV [Lactobacillus pentosus] [Lactiplantibacillus mudanjiangensis]VDG26830.1 fatty acid-binding protein DegV [Lactobacillus pentosus] [Lactiplantibacillus mudanjiangensis]VDG31972.1 fatty acid-binding protein DegV [Lactobacillus pentosus] [Lactiplantibacillus mudanjiangensis]
MRTAIVTDSASYLSAADIQKYDIHVVPITVIFGQQTYLENVEITSKEFYERMRTAAKLPTTTQVTLGQMQQMYDQLAADGYDAVISIHLSSGITSFIPNLESYLPNVTNIKVYPFDSLITAGGEANMVLLAAKLVAAGYSPEQVLQELTKLRATTQVFFIVDNLSHLVRTGRLSNASGLVGNLLRIKPILTFDDAGKIIAIEKERTMRRAYQGIKAKLAHALATTKEPLRAMVVNGNNPKLQAEWVADLHASFPNLIIDESEIGPVVGVHVGEGVMGLFWAQDWEKWPITKN